jgi:VIT1/CCC1 family predicted Fe2+/Mn2+ transporter
MTPGALPDSQSARDGWREEKRSAWLYHAVSRAEPDVRKAAMFADLAASAEGQAAIWAGLLEQAGGTVPAWRPDLRARLVAGLLRVLPPRRLAGVLAAIKVRGMSVYRPALEHAMPTTLAEVGRRHGAAGAGNLLRAAVFGVNDGLVSNTALILGVAGAGAASGSVLLTGIAGLLAGAFSMAAGEYVSVRSQRELYEYQIGLEREELVQYPREEAAELALIYAAKGIPQAEAERLAAHLIADPERALDTLAREEMGLDPSDLGSPWRAAVSSFTAFSLGASVPLLPFFLVAPGDALPASVALAAVALFAVGASLSLFNGRSAWLGGVRMLAIGSLAGAATWFIGGWLGVQTG